jgi:hypothetical protein
LIKPHWQGPKHKDTESTEDAQRRRKLAVHDSLEALLELVGIEVEEEAQPASGDPQIGQELRLVDGL